MDATRLIVVLGTTCLMRDCIYMCILYLPYKFALGSLRTDAARLLAFGIFCMSAFCVRILYLQCLYY